MTFPFDRNLFTQIGLDSGSLTILGAVVHSFREPGQYRGTVHGKKDQAVFYVSVDKNSPLAQVDIDLAALMDPADNSDECCSSRNSQNRFSVNPKGYAVFRVSRGAGGYHVSIRKAEEKPESKIFDSRSLNEGDLFAGTIIRPGTYSLVNTHTDTKAALVVSYPVIGETAYRPPGPVRVQATRECFEPRRINLEPGQGLVFECNTESRIEIELQKPDDGPGHRLKSTTRGWKKNELPENQD